jgi:site-specific DNA-adenine methylase
MIGRVALYAANTVIDRLDWRECIRPYDKPKTLFYYDPPYFQITASILSSSNMSS